MPTSMVVGMLIRVSTSQRTFRRSITRCSSHGINTTLSAKVSAADTYRCGRSEEHTSELQSLMRISYAVFCLKKKTSNHNSEHASTKQITSAVNNSHTKTLHR